MRSSHAPCRTLCPHGSWSPLNAWLLWEISPARGYLASCLGPPEIFIKPYCSFLLPFHKYHWLPVCPALSSEQTDLAPALMELTIQGRSDPGKFFLCWPLIYHQSKPVLGLAKWRLWWWTHNTSYETRYIVLSHLDWYRHGEREMLLLKWHLPPLWSAWMAVIVPKSILQDNWYFKHCNLERLATSMLYLSPNQIKSLRCVLEGVIIFIMWGTHCHRILRCISTAIIDKMQYICILYNMV